MKYLILGDTPFVSITPREARLLSKNTASKTDDNRGLDYVLFSEKGVVATTGAMLFHWLPWDEPAPVDDDDREWDGPIHGDTQLPRDRTYVSKEGLKTLATAAGKRDILIPVRAGDVLMLGTGDAAENYTGYAIYKSWAFDLRPAAERLMNFEVPKAILSGGLDPKLLERAGELLRGLGYVSVRMRPMAELDPFLIYGATEELGKATVVIAQRN